MLIGVFLRLRLVYFSHSFPLQMPFAVIESESENDLYIFLPQDLNLNCQKFIFDAFIVESIALFVF